MKELFSFFHWYRFLFDTEIALLEAGVESLSISILNFISMFFKHFIHKNWKEKILILSLPALLPCFGQAQTDECLPVTCGNLFVEIIRQDTNLLTTCSSASPGACDDKFRQIAYKVYLRSRKTVPNPSLPYNPFYLNYKMLDVIVRLKSTGSTHFSFINTLATKNCFNAGAGANWMGYNTPNGDKVIFSPTTDSVSISFANFSTGNDGCGSTSSNGGTNRIHFTDTSPAFAQSCGITPYEKCIFVELFTIVVNAYPGEKIVLDLNPNNKYEPKSNGTVCTPIAAVTTNSNNRNGLFEFTINNPVSYSNTSNNDIIAELLNPTPAIDGGQIFQIQIKNTGTSTRTVTYLEFVLKALNTLSNMPFSYSGAMPREQSGGTDPATGQKITYLHYQDSPANLVLEPNQTSVIGSIKIGPPPLSNQSWAVTLSFLNSSPKSRIKTQSPSACTYLRTSNFSPAYSYDGNVFCSDKTVVFSVQGMAANCDSFKVRAGLRALHPPVNATLKKVEFELEFFWTSSGISMSGVNFGAWPAANINCASYGCYSQPIPNPNVCYTISGKKFKYCFESDDTHGTTFSLNDFAHMDIGFNVAGNGCIDSVVIRKLDIAYIDSSYACIPAIATITGIPLCGPKVLGNVHTETGVGIDEVKVYLVQATNSGMGSDTCSMICNGSCGVDSVLTDTLGAFGFCQTCINCNRLKAYPEKTDNPLNGVTTYDLVLISKHILSLEPLNSPFKIIAADANKSNSITTFDVVELRKLILGIYNTLPNNKSWRFVDAAYTFPDPSNPFQETFLESKNCIAPPTSGIDFIGVKVGDVNRSAVPHRPAPRPITDLSWPVLRATKGQTITIPITYTGETPIEALQLGLRFDTGLLELIGPSKGAIDSYGAGNFNLLRVGSGEIRTLWLSMSDIPEKIMPGDILFYLSFKVLETLPNGGMPLQIDHQLLEGAAWRPDGEEYRLQYTPLTRADRESDRQQPESALQASIHPNPGSGVASLDIQAAKVESARISFFDAFGKRLFMREIILVQGTQNVTIPELAQLSPGVYLWKVITRSDQAQGNWIKQ